MKQSNKINYRMITASATISGFYLTLVGFGSVYLATIVKIPKLGFSLMFGLALLSILILRTDLFTGSVMRVFSLVYTGKLTRKIGYSELVHSLLGNFIGAMLLVQLFILSRSYTENMDKIILNLVYIKIGYTIPELIFKGILCNICVCTAILLYNRTKGFSQIFVTMAMIFIFVLLGFEHSIVNIGLFIYVILHLHYMNWLLLYNLLFVTFGNVLGGIIVAYIKIFLEKNIKQAKLEEV